MSISENFPAQLPPQTFADSYRRSLGDVDELPSVWPYLGASYRLTPVDDSTWQVIHRSTVLGTLTAERPLIAGGATSWKIGHPAQENLGVGVSWMSWEDAVANLIDYRRNGGPPA
jgi:hypothetical protein